MMGITGVVSSALIRGNGGVATAERLGVRAKSDEGNPGKDSVGDFAGIPPRSAERGGDSGKASILLSRAGRQENSCPVVGACSPARCTSAPCTRCTSGNGAWLPGIRDCRPCSTFRSSMYKSFRTAANPGRFRKHSSARRATLGEDAVPQRVAIPFRTLIPRRCPASTSS